MTLSDLARHLPNRDAIAGKIATRQPRSTGRYAGALSLGLVAGAAIALMLTPKSGRELRKQISNRTSSLRKRAKAVLPNGHAEPRANS